MVEVQAAPTRTVTSEKKGFFDEAELLKEQEARLRQLRLYLLRLGISRPLGPNQNTPERRSGYAHAGVLIQNLATAAERGLDRPGVRAAASELMIRLQEHVAAGHIGPEALTRAQAILDGEQITPINATLLSEVGFDWLGIEDEDPDTRPGGWRE